MTLYFSNPGDFDIRLLSTFGVSAKPSSTNPIGKFGTGLKNAVAGVLRLGGTVTIHTPSIEYTIFAKKEEFRGTEHEMVWMQGDRTSQPLSFSTALGSHWEPWMIYREFLANQRDEGGPLLPSTIYPSEPGVVFCVSCEEVEEVTAKHNSYFHDKKAEVTIGEVEIIFKPCHHIYFRGIQVHTSTKPYLFTYNFLSGLSLTEDRTVGEWSINSTLIKAISQNTQEDQIEVAKAILEATTSHPEANLDWSWLYCVSDSFRKALFFATKAGKANSSARTYARSYIDEVGYNTQVSSNEQLALRSSVEENITKLFALLGKPLPEITLFLSKEVEESCHWNEHRDAYYLHPDAYQDEETLFNTLLEVFISAEGEGIDDTKRKMLFAYCYGSPKEEPEEMPNTEPTQPCDEILF